MKKLNIKRRKKGMSLIVLIITIIVVIILAAAVILTISKNNPVTSAKEATFKSDIRSFQEDLAMYISKDILKDYYGNRNKITTSGEPNFDEMQEYISSFTKKYEGKLGIEKDKLVYFKEKVTAQEQKWLEDLGIRAAGYTISEASEECFSWSGDSITGIVQEKMDEYLLANNGVLKIPKRCKQISKDAIKNNNITKIIIQDGCENIGFRGIMQCNNLKEVCIPKTLTNVYDTHSFILFCNNIESIVVDEENPKYYSKDGVMYFKDSNSLMKAPAAIEEYEIPVGVTKILPYAFEECIKLKKIVIPDTVTSIGEYAFQECPLEYETFVIPDNVKEIGAHAFSYAQINKLIVGGNLEKIPRDALPDNLSQLEVKENSINFSSENNILYNKDKTKIEYALETLNLTDFTIPSTVKEIKAYAFFGCTGLNGTLYIPSSVTTIGSRAFDGTSLEEINCEITAMPQGWNSNFITNESVLINYGVSINN